MVKSRATRSAETVEGPNYSTVKTSLQSIVKSDDIIQKITETVDAINRIRIHTLHFLKLLFITNPERLPIIDESLILNTMRLFAKREREKRLQEKSLKINSLLAPVFRDYRATISPHQHFPRQQSSSCKNLTQILNYMTTDIVTMYENAIKQNYVSYIERFVNVVCQKNERIQPLDKKEKSALCTTLRKIKESLLTRNFDEFHQRCIDLVGSEDFNDEVMGFLPFVIPSDIHENGIKYDLQCRPQAYLPCMIYMVQFFEKNGVSLPNLFPNQTSVIPTYITIDASTSIKLLYQRKKQGPTKQSLLKNIHQIWSRLFRTELRCFHKKGFTFRFIKTDGVGCSLVFERDQPVPTKKIKLTEPYVDEIDPLSLQGKRIIGIDPGKCDLIYCTGEDTGHAKKFRFSQNQRRFELQTKAYQTMRKQLAKSSEEIVDGKTPEEWHAWVSELNGKTVDVTRYLAYLQRKNHVNELLMNHYAKPIYRRLRWKSYINKKRSEQRLINLFSAHYGKSNNVVLCFGDFEQKKHMKFKEPTMGKGMRQLFRRAGYRVLLVDEFRTSCRCHDCGGVCEKFIYAPNPRPWKREKKPIVKRHGILRCSSCSRTWNRDCNGALNIMKIAQCVRSNVSRPDYMQR